jgi:aminoglycoside 6'-N-acetyltransferase I
MGEVVIHLLRKGEEGVLARLAPGVFDKPIDASLLTEFLDDPRHHLALAIDDGLVVGMASGVDYVNPDKPRELWINEVGVAASHRQQGLASRLLEVLFAEGRARGCWQAWVLTNRSNAAAMRLYAGAGGQLDADDTAMFTVDLRT